MAASRRMTNPRKIIDLLVVDREDRPILIGELKTRPIAETAALAQVRAYLDLADLTVPFVMLADLARIRIYRGDDGLEGSPIFSVETGPILGYYSTYYQKAEAGRTISQDFFLDLVLSWLRDLSYRWRSKAVLPPAYEELDRLGLIPLLKGAIFESEVQIGGDRLS